VDDGRRDFVDGGRGSDGAYADEFDRFRSVELVHPSFRESP
jgi:hypothetical protein